ncbi:MAG TPA: NADPH:quinone oxidoreductase family protein [Pyrinomonadaceae bacterium]|nr:NADPH:quinone oxidoreductase family protein [Pyrinomonadaceae bacterium]
MKAARVNAFGEVDQLEIVDLPDPVAGKGEVVVRVKAGGLNYADVMQRLGLYPGGPTPTYIAGMEGAGVVESHGPGTVNAPPVGSRVVALGRGAHAELFSTDARACIPLPENMSFVEGAAFPVQYLTAYHTLVTLAHAQAGETILIHAAAGGVGTAAIQIAKLLGLRIVATASTAEKRAKVLELGADVAVGYDEFEGASRELTGGRGPDICLESIGGDVFRRSLAMIPALGRLVVFGAASREAQPIDTLKLFFRSQSVMGFHLNGIIGRPDLMISSLSTLLTWISMGQIKIQVGHTFPLAEIRKAHELIASRQSYGKIVLQVL